MKDTPTLNRENALREAGYRRIAGVDEAGRGPLAGPVVAAAVILPEAVRFPWLSDVRDSKQLTARQRATLAASIQAEALAVGVGVVEAEAIDTVGIGVASRQAMVQALAQLDGSPDFALVDGRDRLDLSLPQTPIIHGDALCLSVAAASIVAKVTRDGIMDGLAQVYPNWGFSRHKGYPTADHLALLQVLEPTPVHRRSFAPVRQAFERRQGVPQAVVRLAAPVSRQAVGRRGEDLAVAYLQGLGYRVRERNYRCPLGEIDIVAEQDTTLVVIEVRTRRSHSYGTPAESITPGKAARLVALEQYYRSQRDGLPPYSRVDVVAVDLGARLEPVSITVIQNAVEDTGLMRSRKPREIRSW